jgi:hypothetical protein
MSKQIFKKNPPIELLLILLEKICLKTEKYYIFNNIAFKKGLYNNNIDDFIKECIPYYHLSKQKYLETQKEKYLEKKIKKTLKNNNYKKKYLEKQKEKYLEKK